jgi:transketolase
MRGVFFDRLKEEIRKNPSIFFLTAATGYHLVEDIFEEFPERTLNVGVAEANLIGIASGLANIGYIPVCYAITNFLVQRPFEQIRDEICLHKQKVILIGTNTGYELGALGATHHIIDDIGALKVLPNLNIYSPSGKKSMDRVFQEAFESDNASFIRVSKEGLVEPCEVNSPNHFIKENDSETLIISHGKMITNALKSYEQSSSFSLYAMDRVKPLDDSDLHRLFKKYKKIYILEDNFRSGLFNSICQWSIESNSSHKNIFSISPPEAYDEVLGSCEFLEELHGLSPSKILNKITS